MSNYLSISSGSTVLDPYSGVHAANAIIYADEGEAAARPVSSEPIGKAYTVPKAPVRIELPHIGVVLSISVEGRSSTYAQRAEPTALVTMSKGDVMRDPVVEQLICDLNRSDASSSSLTGVYTDAVRLAVLARCLGLSSAGPATPCAKQPAAALPKWRLKRVTDYIDENIAEPLTLADLAQAAGLSRMYFAAQFRAATGLRPHEYVLRKRIERAKTLLTETDEALADIAFSVGFQTQSHFTTVFKRVVGTTPGQWRSLRPLNL